RHVRRRPRRPDQPGGTARRPRWRRAACGRPVGDGRGGRPRAPVCGGGGPRGAAPPATADAAARATLSDVRVVPVGGTRGTQSVTIAFVLGGPGNVSIRVFDAAGRLVRTVNSAEPRGGGANTVSWDGAGQDGRAVANGLYWVRVEAFGQRVNKKVAI